MRIIKFFIVLTGLILSLSTYLSTQSRIADTKHNLSISGPGQYRSLDETRICFFCHTPHTAYPKQPLWNHALSSVTHYKTYQSRSFEAAILGQVPHRIDSASRLCLSCHDGTVALSTTVNGDLSVSQTENLGPLPLISSGYIGTDLSGMHPISFTVTEHIITMNNTKDSPLAPLYTMTNDPEVHLDTNHKMQCTSCHNVHSDKNFQTSGIHFWAKPTFNEVCQVCHIF